MASLRWTPEQYEAHIARKQQQAAAAPKRRRPKYGNQKATTAQNESVDSQREARHIAEFRALGRAGAIVAYARQVEVWLPGGIKMVVDHLVMQPDGTWHFADSKGYTTRDWRNKQKLAASVGIEIKTL